MAAADDDGAEGDEDDVEAAADVEMAGGRSDVPGDPLLDFVIMGGGGPRVDMLGRASPFSAERLLKLIVTSERGEK